MSLSKAAQKSALDGLRSRLRQAMADIRLLKLSTEKGERPVFDAVEFRLREGGVNG
jgi:hypothetical protein